jgi:acid phosphatase type 7
VQRRWARLAVVATTAVLAGGLTACLPGRPAPPPDTDDAFLLAVGDIASCDETADTATGNLVRLLPGGIAGLGDLAYDDGTLQEFERCFGPTWGHARQRFYPAPGNHEYETADAAGYFDYFGRLAGRSRRGWYAYDYGSWRVLSLNSEVRIEEQVAFIHAQAAGRRCVLAYWHTPFRSSGAHGADRSVRPLWRAASEAGVDLVLSGHDHDYERFGRLGPRGYPNPGGMRQIVVGTGGRHLRPFVGAVRGSEVREAGTYGVLQLRLGRGFYRWRFWPANGTFTDRGADLCR